MRAQYRFLIPVLVLMACGDSSGPVEPDGQDPFTLRTPEFELAAGAEAFVCYYLRTPNDEDIAVRRFRATLPAEAVSAILFVTASELQPDGTLTESPCNFGGPEGAVIAFIARHGATSLSFPDDDGDGRRVAWPLAAGEFAVVRVHYVNASDEEVVVQTGIEVTPTSDEVTEAGSFVTWNAEIVIPPASQTTVSQSCAVPSTMRFFALTTHSQKHSIATAIRDGSTTLFESDDWISPGIATRLAAPFFSFGGSGMTYECQYNNTGAATIHTGTGPDDEICSAVGYFFPATGNVFCVNNIVIPQSEWSARAPSARARR